MARLDASKGYDFIVVARRADPLTALAIELTAFGATTESVVVDLSEQVGAWAVHEAVAHRPVDVLVKP